MVEITRRSLAQRLSALLAAGTLGFETSRTASAEDAPAPAKPVSKFGFDDVMRRARDLAGAPFEADPPALPPAVGKLDFDVWRDIRFRPEKAFLNVPGSLFHLE